MQAVRKNPGHRPRGTCDSEHLISISAFSISGNRRSRFFADFRRVGIPIFLQNAPADFRIIRPVKIGNLFSHNDLGDSPYCFLQPKPPFSSFFRTIRPTFATAGVALFIAPPRRNPAFPRPLSAFPFPILQRGFATSGVNYAKTQLRRAPCKIPPSCRPPLQNPQPRHPQTLCFPVQIPNPKSQIANPSRHPGAKKRKSSPQPLLHNSQPGGGKAEARSAFRFVLSAFLFPLPQKFLSAGRKTANYLR